jgi:predicted phage-related endonuclease
MDINTIIADYIAAKEAERDAKKRADAMKKTILQYAGDAETFTTEEYTVIIKTTASERLDTASLYKDFPDIKNTYGKVTTSKTVDAVQTAAANKKSA